MQLLAFNKNRTNVIKRVAILMMICYHSFGPSDYSRYISLVWISGRPLFSWLRDACNPVGVFMVVSGYGMFFSYLKAKKDGLSTVKWQHSLSRIIRLYVPFWIATLLATCIARPHTVVDKLTDIPMLIANLTAYYPTYNMVGWYIAPFVLTSLFIDRIFKWFEKYEIAFLIFGLLYYYGMAKVYGMAYDRIAEHQWLLILCRTSEFYLPMMLGASAAKHSSWNCKFIMNEKIVTAICAVVVILMFAYSSWKGIPAYPVYCAVLVLLIANVRLSRYSEKIFAFLGVHSMNIWFIHNFFFKWAFMAQYPILILITDIIISIGVSYVINFLSNPIVTRLTKLVRDY